MRENFVNQATTALSAALTSTAMGFSVTASQGNLFPTSYFYITIDAEVMLIAQRVGDTFTIGARGQDNSVAASHLSSATVQLDLCAIHLIHLWQNVADTYNPAVPQSQIPGTGALSQYAYDGEFEGPQNVWGNTWTLYPSPSGGTVWNAGSTLFSQLLLSRATNDNALYTAYMALPLSGSTYTLTACISHSGSFLNTPGDSAQLRLFVCDQSNPTAGVNTGTRFQLILTAKSDVDSNGVTTNTHQLQVGTTTSGVPTLLTPIVSLSPGAPIYLRLVSGSTGWFAYVGDGVTYWPVVKLTGFSLSTVTMGIACSVVNPSGNWVNQTASIDFVRATPGSVRPSYGS